MSAVEFKDEFPVRQPAVRRIGGKTKNGFEVRATAKANPLPDSLDYGPFIGQGEVVVSRAGVMVVSRIDFTEIPDLIALLQEIYEAPASLAVSR